LEFYVSGEFWESALNCEENLFGGISIWTFLEFWAGFHVCSLRRGGTVLLFCALGNLLCANWVTLDSPEIFEWGDLKCEGRAVSLQYNVRDELFPYNTM
jgi:hypothetical protein